MTTIASLLPLMLKGIWSLLTGSIFWVIVLLVGFQYRRMGKRSRQLLNLPQEPIWRITLIATLYGIGGGIIGSILLLVVGISLQEIGINYLWMTALALMFIQQRFLCFAYAGGVLSLFRLIFGFPQVSIPQVMGLVAILHGVEAVLILFSGHIQPLPLYIRSKKGQIVGGYNLQKFWPLPLVALMAWKVPLANLLQGGVQMPEWWPLIRPEFLAGEGEIMYMMMPVVAALGYGDIAVAEHPKTKTRRASIELFAYSIILLVLAVWASYQPLVSFLPALFGPLGHEFLIHLGQKRELAGSPIFVPPREGVMILHVLPGSPFKKAGIRDGDIILQVAGYSVDSEYNLRTILSAVGHSMEVEFCSPPEKRTKKVTVMRQDRESLGLMAVPQGYEGAYVEVTGSLSLLQKWSRRIFRRR